MSTEKREHHTYSVPIDRLDERNLLFLVLARLERLAENMTDLNQDVSDLTASVTGVTARIAALLSQSQQAVADLTTQVQNLQVDDDAQKAAVVAGLQQVSDLQAQAAAASQGIQADIADLDSLAQPPAPPAPPA